MASNNTVISGRHAGKKVNVVPNVQPAYRLLSKKAKDGSHWARVAIAHLHGLSSGRLSMNNIYVKPGPQLMGGTEEFIVFLPGCKATLERRMNDQFYLVDLSIDNSYAEMDSPKKATGLYKATKDTRSNDWGTTFYKNGQSDASKDEIRIVAIADGGHQDVQSAATRIASSIAKAPDAPSGKNFKIMDIHFTHDQKKLGGLRNANSSRFPLKSKLVHGSAIMLANSMMGSKDKTMTWVSEMGGTAILTQAMRIVADNNVKLESHNIFLYDPTTSPNEAIKMAHLAGIKPDRNAIHTNMFNYMGNRDQIAMIYNRKKGEKGYTYGNACWDFVAQGGKAQGIATIGAGALGAVGITLAAPAIPMVTAIAGALGVAAGAIGLLKTGDSLAANIAPHYYNKHIGKIK